MEAYCGVCDRWYKNEKSLRQHEIDCKRHHKLVALTGAAGGAAGAAEGAASDAFEMDIDQFDPVLASPPRMFGMYRMSIRLWSKCAHACTQSSGPRISSLSVLLIFIVRSRLGADREPEESDDDVQHGFESSSEDSNNDADQMDELADLLEEMGPDDDEIDDELDELDEGELESIGEERSLLQSV